MFGAMEKQSQNRRVGDWVQLVGTTRKLEKLFEGKGGETTRKSFPIK